MTATDTNPSERLQALLAGGASDPAPLVASLAAARQEVAREGVLTRAIERTELDHLRRVAVGPAALPELRRAVGDARARLLEYELRCLMTAGPGEPAALFDLAELRAECLLLGLVPIAERCSSAIAQRVQPVAEDPRKGQEAAERWAALQTEEEDLHLGHKVLLLRETSGVLALLAARTGDRRLRSFARRLRAAAGDRELAVRLEGLLTPRGAAILERTSFLLLFAVLAVVFGDLFLDLSAQQRHSLLWIDAGICVFFVAEFLLKLALAPQRLSWFLRNAVTDLLPAIPAVLFLLPTPPALGEAGDVVALRALRMFRIAWAARYVQALRPVLRLVRLLLLLVRGMDGLVQRFSPLLNRSFVFFERATDDREVEAPEKARRRLCFAALRREHGLLAQLEGGQRDGLLVQRARELSRRVDQAEPAWPMAPGHGASLRDIPVEEAVEFLWRLRPEELEEHLSSTDVAALDRVARVVSAPLIRVLPLARRLAVRPLPATAEERVVAMGRRVAMWLEKWQERMTFLADLHGIMTGPQILDRVASAMVRVSQRPAVRLLFFGGVFLLLKLLVGDNCLSNIVGLPLVILGSVCLVFLTLGWWLKRIAGEAADSFRMISEAHFVALMHLVKRRREKEDLQFLASRVFRWEMDADRAAAQLLRRVTEIRRGVALEGDDSPVEMRQAVDRASLLYLHFLDGAILHESDVKTTEQLLANLSMENIRSGHLGFCARDRKRLRKLRLDDGSLLTGPYLWFRFITESIAVETAKRITEYNRRCLTRDQRRHASAGEVEAMTAWLATRRDATRGRTLERTVPPGGSTYRNTEFNALDFLAMDPEREEHLRALFGDEVVDALLVDRRHMIRQVFGARPLHLLPRNRRSFNAFRFYRERLSHGRVFLVPLYSLWTVLRGVGWVVGRLSQMVREILTPELAMQRRESGEAGFAVARRKIHRMKAPGLMEAMATRVRFDPIYCGAPAGWSTATRFAERPELERDLDFLMMRDRDRAAFLEQAAEVRRHVEAWQAMAHSFEDLWPGTGVTEDRRGGELAVIVAYVTNRDSLRTLLHCPRWLADSLPRIRLGPVPGSWFGDLRRGLDAIFGLHPADRWCGQHGAELGLGWRERRRLRLAYDADHLGARAVIDAWNALAAGVTPVQEARRVLGLAFRDRDAIRRELADLRAVQSLSVLDVRNYRDVVFNLGGYAADGEDPVRAVALP